MNPQHDQYPKGEEEMYKQLHTLTASNGGLLAASPL